MSCVDENGNLITITGIEELDVKVIENKAEISASSGGSEAYVSGWTQQVVRGTGYKCWVFQMLPEKSLWSKQIMILSGLHEESKCNC